jgi:predicted nucleic acid-binding protein
MGGASAGARPGDGRRADPVAILLDGSAVLAAADRADLNHAAAVAWFGRADEPLLLGALTLAELDDLLQRELGVQASLEVVRSLVDGGLRLVAPTREDLERAATLLQEAAEHRPRLADALLVAAAERLGVRRIATFDRRPIAVFRPRHVRAFDLEP